MAERVTFDSSTGPRLAGLIDLPDSAIRGWGVFSHGFTLGKDSPAASRICKQLALDGIGMLRFDALGLGDSEGDWGDGSFTVKVNDVVKACEFMAGRGTPADILVGHSWGGAAVLAAARSSPRVRAVVTVAAPVERHCRIVVAVEVGCDGTSRPTKDTISTDHGHAASCPRSAGQLVAGPWLAHCPFGGNSMSCHDWCRFALRARSACV
jgi:pimeloyl-ACP methyl ester carboxylesterase